VVNKQKFKHKKLQNNLFFKVLMKQQSPFTSFNDTEDKENQAGKSFKTKKII